LTTQVPGEGPDLDAKVAFLSRPGTYAAAGVLVRETRTSWVFLTPGLVYKLKKPIADRDLDFRTLASRRRNAEAETRLNRRLAPDVYLDPLALSVDASGRLHLGDGRVVDWLVVMRRLPQDAFLDRQIAANDVSASAVDALSARLARFYVEAPPVFIAPGSVVCDMHGAIADTAKALREPVFALDTGRIDRLASGQLARLGAVGPEIADRLAAGVWREGHGDLRPEHVCLGEPPVVIDCLEFSERLRRLDPFDEIGFLALECERLGAPWIGPILVRQLEAKFDHRPSPALTGLYRSFRAGFRAHFALRHLLDPVPREPARWRPLAEAYLSIAEASIDRSIKPT
jgi:aminoglycoside phosphotransferase family enzyme